MQSIQSTSIPVQYSLPKASTDTHEIVAATEELKKLFEEGKLAELKEPLKSILSSGQVLAAEAFIRDKQGDPRHVVGTLLCILQGPYTIEADLRYMLARTLRLFAELALLRSRSGQSSLLPEQRSGPIGK